VAQCRSLLEMLKALVNSEAYLDDIRKIHRGIEGIVSLISDLNVDLASFKGAFVCFDYAFVLWVLFWFLSFHLITFLDFVFLHSCLISSDSLDAVKQHILHVHEVLRSGEGDAHSTFLIIVSQLKLVLETTKKQIAAQIQQEGRRLSFSFSSSFFLIELFFLLYCVLINRVDKKIKESTSLLKNL
jgi:hypothetical protein